MTLDELMTIVLQSTPADWASTHAWGTTFLHEFGTVGWKENERVTVAWHDSRWVLKSDVSVGLAYGLPSHGDEQLEFEWAKFPDKAVRGYWADVRLHGQLVHREQLLSVDGHRALMPTPAYLTVPTDGPFGVEAFGERVTESEWKFACLVAELAGNHEQNSYLSRSQLVVVPDDFERTD